ncbi:hypothetical protein IAR50_003829 [Cryptococcus sp. DSM 104548]
MVSSPAVFVLSLLLASQSAFAAKATAPPGRHRHPRGFKQALEERELDERLLPITATTTIVVPMTATHTVWVNPTGGQVVLGDGSDSGDESSSSVVPSASESTGYPSDTESSVEPTASASSASLSSQSLSDSSSIYSGDASATSSYASASTDLPSSSISEYLSASSSLYESSIASGVATNSSSTAEPTSSNSSSPSPSASATETITSSSIEPSSTQASTNASSSYQESSSSSASAPNSTVLSQAESSASETASSSAFVTASESESTGVPSANETSSSSTASETQSASLTDSASSSPLPTESASLSANSSSETVSASATNSSSAFEPSATLSESLNSSSSASASETASASNSSVEATASATESATSSSSGWWWWPTASSSASASETNSTTASASQTDSASESPSASQTNSTSPTASQTQSSSESLSSNASSTATQSATDSWSESISSTPTASATQSNSSTNATSTVSSTSSASSATSTLGTNLMLGYYPDWATNITPEDVDWDRYDILDFAFAVPDSAGGLTWDDDSATDTLSRLVTAAHNAGKRVKVSVGGWTGSAYFSTITASDSLRATFVSNILDLYNDYDLDGIDIDWEYPGTDGADGNAVSSDDSANFLTFLTDLRSALPSGAIITTATQVWPFADSDGNPMTDVSAFAKVIDWILIMNYDVWGSSSTPGPNAPLSDACGNSTQPLANAYAAVSSWTTAGMPADQITLGVPAYGYLQDSTASSLIQRRSVDTTRSLPHRRHAMSLKNSHRKRANDVTVSNEDGGTSDGQVMWYSLLSQGALTLEDGSYVGDGGFTRYWDSCSSTPWLKSTSSGQIITYDDPESMNLKGQFAAQAGLRGCNVFSIDGDYTGSSWPLTDSIRSGLGL